MNERDIQNEHLKLVANCCNNLATALLIAGTFIPAGQYIFHILPHDTPPELLFGTAAIFSVAGAVIHWFGHSMLGGLE